MKIIKARQFPILPPETRWFAVIFECEEKERRFTIMSNCLLSEYELEKRDCGISINPRNKNIPIQDGIKLYSCLKGCLTRISSSNTVSKILEKLKIEAERENIKRKKEKETPATREEVKDIITEFKNESGLVDHDKNQKEHGAGWYERSKSQEE